MQTLQPLFGSLPSPRLGQALSTAPRFGNNSTKPPQDPKDPSSEKPMSDTDQFEKSPDSNSAADDTNASGNASTAQPPADSNDKSKKTEQKEPLTKTVSITDPEQPEDGALERFTTGDDASRPKTPVRTVSITDPARSSDAPIETGETPEPKFPSEEPVEVITTNNDTLSNDSPATVRTVPITDPAQLEVLSEKPFDDAAEDKPNSMKSPTTQADENVTGSSADEPSETAESSPSAEEKNAAGEQTPPQKEPSKLGRWLMMLGFPLALGTGWGLNELGNHYEIVPTGSQVTSSDPVSSKADGDSPIANAFAQFANEFSEDSKGNAVVTHPGNKNRNTTVIVNGDRNEVNVGGLPTTRIITTYSTSSTKPPKPEAKPSTDDAASVNVIDPPAQAETVEEKVIGKIQIGQDYVDAFGNALLANGTAIVQDPMGSGWFESTLIRGGSRMIHIHDPYNYGGLRVRIGPSQVVIRDFLFQNGDVLLQSGPNLIIRRQGEVVHVEPLP